MTRGKTLVWLWKRWLGGGAFSPSPQFCILGASRHKAASWSQKREGSREGETMLQFPGVHWAWVLSISTEYEESWPCFKSLRKRRSFKTDCLLPTAATLPTGICEQLIMKMQLFLCNPELFISYPKPKYTGSSRYFCLKKKCFDL